MMKFNLGKALMIMALILMIAGWFNLEPTKLGYWSNELALGMILLTQGYIISLFRFCAYELTKEN